MYILGISGGVRQGNQDGSAVLSRDGKIIAAVEEERLIRIKHAPGKLPEEAIRFVLQQGGITIKDVDYLVFPGITYKDFKNVLSRFIKSRFGHCPEIELVHHHDAHCASAYYASGFEDAMVLSADLSGDGISTQLSVGHEGNMRIMERFEKPNSLGVFYSILTQFVGFQRDNDEYKVMGLSSYGQRDKYDFNWLLPYGSGTYNLATDYIRTTLQGQSNPSKQEPIYSQKLIERLGEARLPDEAMSHYYEDIAAAGQEHLENVVVDLVSRMHQETNLRKLCFAGGVALNCVLNQKLMNLDYIEELYIQPAASDAGLALGACYIIAKREGFETEPLTDVYLGPQYANAEIKEALDLTNVRHEEISDVASYAAHKVVENKIVGWYQGQMEFGPRALGSRSILANPMNPDMKDIVNNKIKFREQFRPFTPSILEEDLPQYFKGKMKVSPYMTITYDAKQGVSEIIPSVIHVDNTVRVQTVNSCQNALYYEYLQELKKLSGHGITLNTSFNVKGDPVVNTPYNALATFYGSGMDILIMGNFIIKK